MIKLLLYVLRANKQTKKTILFIAGVINGLIETLNIFQTINESNWEIFMSSNTPDFTFWNLISGEDLFMIFTQK